MAKFDSHRFGADVATHLRNAPWGTATAMVRELGLSWHTVCRLKRAGVRDIGVILSVARYLDIDLKHYIKE